MKNPFGLSLLKKVHQDDRGAVTLEHILIIGAIALPVLIFLITRAWPRIEAFFNQGLTDLEEGAQNASGTGSP